METFVDDWGDEVDVESGTKASNHVQLTARWVTTAKGQCPVVLNFTPAQADTLARAIQRAAATSRGHRS